MKTSANIKLIRSVDTYAESIIEFNIIPGEKTPWHYHNLFSESFEVLSGTLEVGLNNQIHQLNKEDKVTVQPNQKHYFNNVSPENCVI